MTALRLILFVLAFLLAACGGERPPIEPIVKTVRVEVPVPVPCAPAVGPRPDYPDGDDEVRAAPDLLERVKLLLAGREMRRAREAELEAAVAGCGARPE
ncbi:MAG: hypothetical protein K2X07_05050 [Caulobacteraceae bacterium]|nr:hypothetical protein [Caulobacteraceae bacterium]